MVEWLCRLIGCLPRLPIISQEVLK
jgi:hypothetical protein